ncbi:MAG: hypothetical protein AMS27_00270 [Bacteroides sp. SM23_62_1]|nr:MAG: hypothetical protein AMS27_00270 [Bacteroides sp. SM23_62_1]
MSDYPIKINHYRNNEIDLTLWDETIISSVNACIYPLSWYLNITCPGWEALITEDYRSVMPLPVSRRYFVPVIIQPALTWQLGIFSKDIMDESLSEQFLCAIPSYYGIKSCQFNKFNALPYSNTIKKRKNTTELELISSYDRIQNEYSDNAKSKIQSALRNRISIMQNISSHEFLQFIYRFDRFSSRPIKPTWLLFLRQILSNVIRYRMGEIHGAYTRENNLCAVVFFIRFKGRQIIHSAAADHEGINHGALYLIIDQYIAENTEKNLILSIDNPSAYNLVSAFKELGAKSYPFISLKKRFIFF